MNLLNDKKLARRLKAGEVSTKERFYYLLILWLYSGLLTTSYLDSREHDLVYDWWAIAADIVLLTFIFLGTALAYNTNKQGDDKEFIERFICISVPIGLQLTFVTLLIISMYTFFYPKEAYYILSDNIFDFGFVILSSGYFYLRLNYLMKIASH